MTKTHSIDDQYLAERAAIDAAFRKERAHGVEQALATHTERADNARAAWLLARGA